MVKKPRVVRPRAIVAKPRVFVASSTESLEVAYAVQKALENDADVTVWTQGVFGPGNYVIEELNKQLNSSDFGVFVLMPDDQTTSRGNRADTPRDNVVFELGLFMGVLGRERSFLLYPKEPNKVRLPIDLLGLVGSRFSTTRTDGNIEAAIGPAADGFRRVMKQLGPKTRNVGVHPSQRTPNDPLLTNLVIGALETVCRAVSIPQNPDSAGLRVFIFRLEDKQLTCTHYWAPSSTREEVGLPIKINAKTAKWAIVRAIKEKDVCLQSVDPVAQSKVAIKAPVLKSIACVLAAPIYSRDRSIWGIVDIDASTQSGCDLLGTPVAKSTLFQLSKHLNLILSLEQQDK